MVVSRVELGRRVQRALSAAGMTQAGLAERVGMSESSLSRAIGGQRNFKSLELALIAEALGVSVEHLVNDVERQPIRLAARVQVNTSPAADQALARAQEIVDLDRLLADLGYERPVRGPYELDARRTPHQEGEALATKVRADLGVADLPYELSRLAQLVEDRLGVDVGFEPLPMGLDGLSVSADALRLALVGSSSSATRQRFTLAHELGHLVAGDVHAVQIDEKIFSDRSPREERANAFAAAFLMPADQLREAVRGGHVSEDLVADLLSRYGVSLDALAFRLHNVGAVNAVGRDRIRATRSSRIALREGRTADLQARNEVRAPGILLARSIEAYVAGAISIRPLARLVRVDPDELLDELGAPAPHEPGDEWGMAL